jgi:hypothetical protein
MIRLGLTIVRWLPRLRRVVVLVGAEMTTPGGVGQTRPLVQVFGEWRLDETAGRLATDLPPEFQPPAADGVDRLLAGVEVALRWRAPLIALILNEGRESMPGMQRVERPEDPAPIRGGAPAADEDPHAAMNASSTTMTSHDTRPPHTARFPGEREWRRKRRRVNLMTIVAGIAAFNTVASVVAGGPNGWTRAWAVALVVALLLMLVRIVRGA